MGCSSPEEGFDNPMGESFSWAYLSPCETRGAFIRLKDVAAGDAQIRHKVGSRVKVLGIDGAGVNKNRAQLTLFEQMCPVCR